MKTLKTILLLIIILANIGCETKRHHAIKTTTKNITALNSTIEYPTNFTPATTHNFKTNQSALENTLVLNLEGYGSLLRVWKTKQNQDSTNNLEDDTIDTIVNYRETNDINFETTKIALLKQLEIENEVTESNLKLYKNNGLTWLELNTTIEGSNIDAHNAKYRYYIYVNETTDVVITVAFKTTTNDFSDINSIIRSFKFN
jgi:hypothetical protein